MIQRIQSIYLLAIALLSGGLVFILKLGKFDNGLDFYALDLFHRASIVEKGIFVGYVLVAILALISIFLYKNRKLQLNLNRFNILINIILLGLLTYYLLNLSGETIVSEKGIGGVLPFISIVLLLLANKAIKKDEALVKSVDRLR